MGDSTKSPKLAADTLPDVEGIIEALFRGDDSQFDTYLAGVERSVEVPSTKARLHCHVIQLDGNSRSRVGDFARWLAYQVVDYAIPRSEIRAAREFDIQFNTTRRWAELVAKARTLFSSIKNTGEGGELLLYVLAQTQLKLPQVFCKMPHKTNAKMHYHGVDGIHVGLDQSGQLALYWGESKLHQKIGSAVTEALDSIKPYVCHPGGDDAVGERDLQLMRDNLDLDSPALEDALLRFLDRDDPAFNRIQFRGVCLIGFDLNDYPDISNPKTSDELLATVRQACVGWLESVGEKIKTRPPLDHIHLELFLVPFPSVDAFRVAFLKELGHES